MSESSQPLVSVVIPVYDDYGPLEDCLRRLESQTYPGRRFEVVVVDNGTPAERTAAVEEAFDGVRRIRHPEGGSYTARNAGIEVAEGELFAFTDADCLPASGWLEAGVAALGESDDVGLVGGAIELFAEDPENPSAAEFWELVSGFPQRHYLRDLHFAATANMFTRRPVFDEVGVFDDALRSGGDREWGERVHEAGYEQVFAPEARIRHPARRRVRALVSKRIRTTKGDYRRRERRGEFSPGTRAAEMARLGAELAMSPLRAGWSAWERLDSTERAATFAATEGILQATKRVTALWELGRRLLDAPDRYERTPRP
jgi:GT2 family glycosyltransferase